MIFKKRGYFLLLNLYLITILIPQTAQAYYSNCGVDYLALNVELTKYSYKANDIENQYKALNKYLTDSIISHSEFVGFDQARIDWRNSYQNFLDANSRLENDLNRVIHDNGKEFTGFCSIASTSADFLIEARRNLENIDRTLASTIERALARPPGNDPYSDRQYYLKTTRIDQIPQSNNVKEIVVAIIDGGIYINHPDLIDNIWRNQFEEPGNAKDDDGNGYIDDYFGYNFVDNSSEMTAKNNHGTQVAGIIGASSNNGIGIRGINPNVRLMSLIACDVDGCNDTSIKNAIRYAVDNGANLINISLSSNGTTRYSTSLNEDLKYASDHGVLVVASSGNGDLEADQGQDLNIIPQSPVCNETGGAVILGVGAVDQFRYLTSWSNFGSKCVDTYAPGVDIFTTSFPDYAYDYVNGTSFAAPIVTGVASLIKQKFPSIKPAELIDIVRRTNKYGVLDANDALKQTYISYQPIELLLPPNPPASTIESITTDESTSNPIGSESTSTLDSVISNEKEIDQRSDEFIKQQMQYVNYIDYKMIDRLKGYILLQVENRGAAWYLDPNSQMRYYMKDGATAYQMLRSFGLGITDQDLQKIPIAGTTNRVSTPKALYGRILLQVQSHGEAWYVHPKTGYRYYLRNGDEAYRVMRELSLGILNKDINRMPIKPFMSKSLSIERIKGKMKYLAIY